MTKKTRFKAFTNPNHRTLEMDFNKWADEEEVPVNVVNMALTYSATLQKFVLAVVYTQDLGDLDLHRKA